MRNLLVEIGVEDLPASQCKDIYNQMLNFLPSLLKEYRLVYKDIDYILTNRRIGFILGNVSEYQEKFFIEKKGPPLSRAFDVNGNITNELIGFLKSVGIDFNTLNYNNKDIILKEIEGIEIKKIADKEYVFYKLEQESKHIKEILSELVNKFINSFRFEKSMYWYDKKVRFIRPIRWVVVILDNELIEFNILNLKTTYNTYGHRIFNNKPLRIRDVSKYNEILREAGVIVFPHERKNIILDSINKYELKNEVNAIFDEDFIDLLVYMYEYPVLVDSSFDEDYLELPNEIILNVIVNQQKFIPLKKDENIINSFLVFKEGFIEDKEILSYNYKKVVEARFRDSLHLLEEDEKIPLASRVPKLKNIAFYEKLGSLYDKTIRIKNIAIYISDLLISDNKIKDNIIKAAHLCKADRDTKIVFEFPNLQGVIGKYIALKQGEEESVANAIYEHYLPDSLENPKFPSDYPGIIVGISDRIDTLIAFYSIGFKISASKDPFALKRTFAQLILLLHHFRLPLNLENIFKYSYSLLRDKNYSDKIEVIVPFSTILKDLKEFFFSRVEENLKLENFKYDYIRSVLHILFHNYKQGIEILEFITGISDKDFEMIKTVAFLSKRLKNIIFLDYFKNIEIKEDSIFKYIYRKYSNIDIIDYPEEVDFIKVNKELFDNNFEFELIDYIENNKESYIKSIIKSNYTEAFEFIKGLAKIVDNYFNNVMIMVENKEKRLNRILSLYYAFLLTIKFADFSQLSL
ncbi:MAG: glycine--tRNA ligase subunit beta [bacterium]|nr:glycine--tRNA ligase subunit beta [bacterium]